MVLHDNHSMICSIQSLKAAQFRLNTANNVYLEIQK